MKKLIKLLVLSILLGLQCCKEDELVEYPISYPMNYVNSPVTEFTIKAFTKDGEITDSTKFNYLLKKYGYLLSGINNYSSEGDFTATYLDSENVMIRKAKSDKTDTLTVHKTTDLIYWERKDTISTFIRHNSIYKYKPLYYEEFLIPYSSGFTIAAKYKQCYYVKTENKDLILPMFDMLYYMHDSYPPPFSDNINNEFYIHDSYIPLFSVNINNEFCRDSVSILGVNDTIIIKVYTLRLIKQ